MDKDLVYRAGAAILDLDNPLKVLARTKEPILQPEELYERIGDVNNVVFPTGDEDIIGPTIQESVKAR